MSDYARGFRAGIEAAVKAITEIVPDPAGPATGHTNTMRVALFDAIKRVQGLAPAAPEPSEADVERVARAITGPYRPVPEGSPFTLDDIRHRRWRLLTEQERAERMTQARAALAAMKGEG